MVENFPDEVLSPKQIENIQRRRLNIESRREERIAKARLKQEERLAIAKLKQREKAIKQQSILKKHEKDIAEKKLIAEKVKERLQQKHERILAEKKLEKIEAKEKHKRDIEEKKALKKLEQKEKLAFAEKKLKAKTKLKLARFYARSTASRERAIRKIQPAPRLSQEQGMLREMFGGSAPLWGSGQDLPKLHNTLISGGGLVKSGDRGETASMFGF